MKHTRTEAIFKENSPHISQANDDNDSMMLELGKWKGVKPFELAYWLSLAGRDPHIISAR